MLALILGATIVTATNLLNKADSPLLTNNSESAVYVFVKSGLMPLNIVDATIYGEDGEELAAVTPDGAITFKAEPPVVIRRLLEIIWMHCDSYTTDEKLQVLTRCHRNTEYARCMSKLLVASTNLILKQRAVREVIADELSDNHGRSAEELAQRVRDVIAEESAAWDAYKTALRNWEMEIEAIEREIATGEWMHGPPEKEQNKEQQ